MAYKVMILALVAAVSAVSAEEVCAGCPVKQDPASFPVDKLNVALAAAGVNSGVEKVLSVKTQIVAGLKYEVVYLSTSGKTCTATWIDAPWESKFPVGTHVSCRSKRSLGGFKDVDASEMDDIKALSEAAANEEVNGFRRIVVDVLKAKKQVVKGLLYKVTYIVKTTSCRPGDIPTTECLNKETAPQQVCDSVFYAAPFLTMGSSKVEVMSTECETRFGSFIAAPGKLTTGNDEQEKKRAEMFAVYNANQAINSLYYQGLYNVESVEEKMEAGGKQYNIKFQLRNTDCLKQDGLEAPEKCHFTKDVTDTECSTSVWMRPFTGYMKIQSSACSSASA